jgi:hypothetical protein
MGCGLIPARLGVGVEPRSISHLVQTVAPVNSAPGHLPLLAVTGHRRPSLSPFELGIHSAVTSSSSSTSFKLEPTTTNWFTLVQASSRATPCPVSHRRPAEFHQGSRRREGEESISYLTLWAERPRWAGPFPIWLGQTSVVTAQVNSPIYYISFDLIHFKFKLLIFLGIWLYSNKL